MEKTFKGHAGSIQALAFSPGSERSIYLKRQCMQPPLAYFLTWTTYGTWLPGDERGWIEAGKLGTK